MGYVPLFDTLTTGTLYGKWPDIGLWPVILSMADRFGKLDVTPQYISGVTGLELSEVVACMERFCSPDPDSRTKTGDDEGRRLERLEADRQWGWRVVNHAKYREKARLLSRDSERTANGLDAERKRKERGSPPKSPEFPPSDEDEDGEENSGKEEEVAVAPPRPSKKKSTGSRIPEGWEPTPEERAYAVEHLPKVNIPALAECFRDHWTAKAGAGGVKLDWGATWRTWVRRSNEYGYPMMNGAEAAKVQRVKRYDFQGREISEAN